MYFIARNLACFIRKGISDLKRLLHLIKLFPRASRYRYLIASLVPVTLGATLSYAEHNRFCLLTFALTLVGICGAHLAVNFFNDYFDHRYGVDQPHPPRPFSGGSQVIQEGLETPKEFLAQALILTAVAVVSTLALAALAGTGFLLFAFLGGFLGYFYSARPLLLSWRGLGELTTGFCFGPLAVAGSYYVQGGYLSTSGLFISLVPGALVGAVLYVNQFPDFNQDRRAGKITLPIKLGRRRAPSLLYLLLAIGFLPVFLGKLLPLSPSFAYLALVGLFPAFMAAGLLKCIPSGQDSSNPGRLMLISYTLTHLFLLLGVLAY